MNAPDYSLPHSDKQALAQARWWLISGVIALGVAGIFAGVLGSSKAAFFYTALVVHVDLSVLVWFLTMACLFFTLAAEGRGMALIINASLGCVAAGTAMIILSALTGGAPYMSNYIPVIHHPVFFLGLSLLLCGTLGTAFNLLATSWRRGSTNPQQFGVASSALILLIALACFVKSQQSLPGDMSGQIYYEYAFWGGGHVLQFMHTQLMMVAWFWLAGAASLKIRLSDKMITALYAIGFLFALVVPFIYLKYDPMSDEHRNAFTLLMKHGNGLAALIAGVFIVAAFVIPAKAGISDEKREIPAFAGITLLMSILLFAAGGGLGYLISGSNLVVPAHYHGSIIGVTTAFMGVAYLLLPSFGFADVSRSKLAIWQPIIYGSGQLSWMVGMAILGEYGAPRKTPGSVNMAGNFVAFLKHSADGLALIGGLLFVFVVLRAVYQKPLRAL